MHLSKVVYKHSQGIKTYGFSVVSALRPLHTESEMFVQKIRTLKNKYDLTLCQSRLHTADETFVHHKKIRKGLIFCIFRICSKHFERCFDNSEPPYKRTPKSRMAIVKFILRLAAQSNVKILAH